jgi:lipopolysaccharide export system protein LptC
MDDFRQEPHDYQRLGRLTVDEGRSTQVNHFYSRFVRSLRFILPIVALVMTVIVLTWNEAGRRVEPLKKTEVVDTAANIQNELIKPVYNSVDDKNQPFTVTADKATQGRDNPDIVELEKPVAALTQADGSKIEGDAAVGLYEQKSQKLNLSGDVHLKHSDGFTLSTEELRVDLATQKAYSGRDVRVEGPDGTIDATGLEGDTETGTLIFTGPAKVILNSESNLLTPKAKKTP